MNRPVNINRSLHSPTFLSAYSSSSVLMRNGTKHQNYKRLLDQFYLNQIPNLGTEAKAMPANKQKQRLCAEVLYQAALFTGILRHIVTE